MNNDKFPRGVTVGPFNDGIDSPVALRMRDDGLCGESVMQTTMRELAIALQPFEAQKIAHVAFRIAESIYRPHGPVMTTAEIHNQIGHLYDNEN